LHKEEGIDFCLAKTRIDSFNLLEQRYQALAIDCFAEQHQPITNEILFICGFPSERSKYLYGTLATKGVPICVSQTVHLGRADKNNRNFRMRYSPETFISQSERSKPLPIPNGMSGSFVWNTRFYECKRSGEQWSPEISQVTGLVHRWISKNDTSLVATKIEHILPLLPVSQK
jgi:hypothetical protein